MSVIDENGNVKLPSSDIPLTAWKLVSRNRGRAEMGAFSLDILYFQQHGEGPPPPSNEPIIVWAH